MTRPRICRNIGKTPNNDNGTLVFILAVSRICTSALAPTFVPDPPGKYTDKDLQRATKLALESFV